MKKFEDYIDGELVTYKGSWVTYEAFKSKYTHNAFRLKRENEEIIADITEISPAGIENEKSNRNLQPGIGKTRDFDEDDIDGFFGGYKIQD